MLIDLLSTKAKSDSTKKYKIIYKIIKCKTEITVGWHKTGIDVGESTASLSYKFVVLCKTSLPV
jgi:hypothetical protein